MLPLDPSIKHSRAGAEETFQVVPALIIVIICVGVVLAAVHHSSTAAQQRASESRAGMQAEIVLGALRSDPAVIDETGVVSLNATRAVATGAANLSFLPPGVRVISLAWFPAGGEVFLVGNKSALSNHLVFAAQPVSVRMDDGSVRPGLLRVGVER